MAFAWVTAWTLSPANAPPPMLPSDHRANFTGTRKFLVDLASRFERDDVAQVNDLVLATKTEINQNKIQMNFFPFVKKQVIWKEVKSAEIVNYGFVGGWGIRFGTKFGTVYNTRGNKGLAIELINGEKFLIGTQKETELNKIVSKAKALTVYKQ